MHTLHDCLVNSLARQFVEKNITLEKKDLEEIFHSVSEAVCPLLEKELMNGARKTFRHNEKELKGFLKRNNLRWKNGFSLLGIFIEICLETGSEYNTLYRPDAAETQDYVFEAIIMNHAKSCLIAREVYCLLTNGFSDGANARWRTLHELAVISNFISEHGQECAKKYLEHQYVELYYEMKTARKYESKNNRQGPSDKLYKKCEDIYNDLVSKYGKGFKKKGYGWAANYLAGQDANFANIESSVKLDHWRPYYGDASQYLHGGAAGTPKLALEECSTNILLVGQSNSGMVEPGHSTALSLALATIPILLRKPISFDSILLGKIILNISSKVGELFFKDYQAAMKEDLS